MGIFNIFIIPEQSFYRRALDFPQSGRALFQNRQKRLISLAESSAVVGFRDPDSGRGDWIFDKESLDEYRLNQAGPSRDREKVLRLMQGVG